MKTKKISYLEDEIFFLKEEIQKLRSGSDNPVHNKELEVQALKTADKASSEYTETELNEPEAEKISEENVPVDLVLKSEITPKADQTIIPEKKAKERSIMDP